ncbi:hypothetical protein ABKN59_006153 [Abortiporus biennis]
MFFVCKANMVCMPTRMLAAFCSRVLLTVGFHSERGIDQFTLRVVDPRVLWKVAPSPILQEGLFLLNLLPITASSMKTR